MEIIYSKNKYEQEYKAEAQDLLVQLENSQIKNSKLDNKFPVGLAIGGGAIKQPKKIWCLTSLPPKKKGRNILAGVIDRLLRNTAELRNWLESMESMEKEQALDEADYILRFGMLTLLTWLNDYRSDYKNKSGQISRKHKNNQQASHEKG
ncbi:7585_t:CDS:2 [Ambispora leptoticha]|uniref:7585_t:CDS:1 n=1 Tax=Ambispora leptoticha TaxID=144679 RepID=A0A9N9G5Z2_9GLOM|nr:7585_t:CDS:2 [Ambispora leptoticha]